MVGRQSRRPSLFGESPRADGREICVPSWRLGRAAAVCDVGIYVKDTANSSNTAVAIERWIPLHVRGSAARARSPVDHAWHGATRGSTKGKCHPEQFRPLQTYLPFRSFSGIVPFLVRSSRSIIPRPHRATTPYRNTREGDPAHLHVSGLFLRAGFFICNRR